MDGNAASARCRFERLLFFFVVCLTVCAIDGDRGDIEVFDTIEALHVSDLKLDDFPQSHPREQGDERHPVLCRLAEHDIARFLPVALRPAARVNRCGEHVIEFIDAPRMALLPFALVLSALDAQIRHRIDHVLSRDLAHSKNSETVPILSLMVIGLSNSTLSPANS